MVVVVTGLQFRPSLALLPNFVFFLGEVRCRVNEEDLLIGVQDLNYFLFIIPYSLT